MFDVVVIGGGIMGASSARYLAEAGLRTAVVAPPEPSTADGSPGPHGAHYDVSRLSWVDHVDPDETELSRRSMWAIASIEAISDTDVYARSGHLFIADPGHGEEQLRRGGSEIMDATTVSRRFPEIALRDGARAYWEDAPAGHFNPRQLVAAQLRAAMRAGAELFAITAAGIDENTVTLGDGRALSCRKVLVATGAYANTPGLLPRPVALRFKTETVLLAQLDPSEARRLADLPTLVYRLSDPAIEDVYTAPPLPYPDGSILLKWGANTVLDRWVATVDDIDDWYADGDSDGAIELMAPSMLLTYRGLHVDGFRTERCVVAYTGHGMPYIDAIDPGRLYIATGGNGHSAKWSAALGRLAASLVEHDEWVDPLPADRFKVQWEGEVTAWAGKELLSERR